MIPPFGARGLGFPGNVETSLNGIPAASVEAFRRDLEVLGDGSSNPK